MISNSVALLLLLAASSRAYSSWQDRIPNGRNVPHPCKANYIWRGVGHQNPEGRGPKNPFGLAFQAQSLTWTQELCQADSDGDGKTNGEELGDANCTWTAGTLPTRTTDITHPGVCDPMTAVNCQGRNDFVDCGLAE